MSLLSGVSAQAVPKITFKFSAVLSPMLILWFLRIYLTMASSNLSPATLIDVLTTIPPNEITATSVVPPPISTTIEPQGLEISSPAPKAAATGSSIINTCPAPALFVACSTARLSTSVTLLGTQTAILGFLNQWKPTDLPIKYLIILSVTSKFEITPSLSGLIATILSGVLPSIFLASSPTATIELVLSSIATTEGS